MGEKENLDKNLKLVLKASYLVFIGLLVSKVLTYLYRIIIARNFGPEIYGVFSLSIMVLGLFAAFSSLGLMQGLLRFVPWYRGKKQENKANYLIKISLITVIISGIISGIFFFIFSKYIAINLFHSKELVSFLQIFSFILPFFLLSNVLLAIIQAYEKIGWYSFILNILQNVTKVLFLLFFIYAGLTNEPIAVSYSLGIISMLIVASFYCKKGLHIHFVQKKLLDEEKTKIKKEFFHFSWPLLFYALVSLIFYWMDSFSIGFFKSPFEVGIYNAAVPIAILLTFASEIFIKLFFPLVTKELSKRNNFLVEELSKQVQKWVFLINLPFALLIFFFPGVLINFLFGPEYLSAVNSLKILAVGGMIASLSWIPNSLVLAKGKSKIILYNILFTSILNLFLNIILVPKYGIEGAAFSTTVSKILLTIILFIEIKKNYNFIPLRRKMFNIFLSSLFPLTLLLFLKQVIEIKTATLILLGIAFYLIYFLLIFITHSFDKNDLLILKRIKNKLNYINL